MHRDLTATLVGGGLVGALPIWILQWRWVGHPLGNDADLETVVQQLFAHGIRRIAFVPLESNPLTVPS